MDIDSSAMKDSPEDSPEDGIDTDQKNDFTSSKLGTKDYWDEAYKRELQTFHDIGDVGEIWFGEESMDRVTRWIETQNLPNDISILDIGTGNGMFLVELARNGFRNLTGIDYSVASVELARSVLREEGLTDVNLEEMDFLSPPTSASSTPTFDLCIDKGTFDAISLSPEDGEQAKKRYVSSLRRLLRPQPHGLFIITSCNWTKEQLLHIFSTGFELVKELPTPRFQFGGVTGNSVTALVFRLQA
ncbi:EEF1A lysine methyltransferase 2 [Engraulis encrasicolus]|uniref:EEF1A lysine methyltransferase 2 n=1 Tax=Engraulis encrasicolus TaxID=184585 RepID=UPI002FD11087